MSLVNFRGYFSKILQGANASAKAVSSVSRKAGSAGSKAHNLLKTTGRKASAERRAGGKKN